MLQAEEILQNRYQLKQKLGHNASRQTWLAQDLHSLEKVVVKLLTFSDQVQWDNLRLFEREAQVLKQLNHSRIPKYRDYFCMDDQMLWFGLVQEYIPGPSLKELLAQGENFTEKQVRAIAQNILNILIYLHSLSPPVLHRDIKPSNLILGEDDYIYLVDFGAVQDKAAAEGATFTVVGTYGYAPLEQLGGRATPASDLYALGATLIHLLTGVAPADLPQKDARFQFADRVNLNPGFVRWLLKLTEPNLSRRFRTAHQALKELKKNQTASSFIVHPQPSNSWIQIKKSPRSLQIKIPSSFADTIVCFNHQYFEIEWKLLGICLRRQQGQTLEIDNVCRSYYKQKIPEIILAVGVQEYAFGRMNPSLSEAECYWLVEEIKSWLGLSERVGEQRGSKSRESVAAQLRARPNWGRGAEKLEFLYVEGTGRFARCYKPGRYYKIATNLKKN